LRGRSAAEAWLAARPKAAASSIKECFFIPVLPLSRALARLEFPEI